MMLVTYREIFKKLQHHFALKLHKTMLFATGIKEQRQYPALLFLDLNAWALNYHETQNGTEFHEIIESVASGTSGEAELEQWFVERARPIVLS